MLFNSVLLAALASVALAKPIANNRVVHEKRAFIPHNKAGRVQEDAVIPIRFALKQTNLEHGYDQVMDVSDPSSANYGKHWTLEQVRKYFAPPEENISALKAWLLESGIPAEMIGESDDRSWIGINIPVRQAEELLGAQYHEHLDGEDKVRLGCDEYSLPSHISQVVDYVKPGIALSPPIMKRGLERRDAKAIYSIEAAEHFNGGPVSKPTTVKVSGPNGVADAASSLSTCGDSISPACQRALYSIPNGTVNEAANNLGIAEFGTSYSQSDLNDFFAARAPYVPQGTHPTLVAIDGGSAPSSTKQANGEADVDFQISIALTYPQQNVLYQVGPNTAFKGTNAQANAELTFLTPLLDAIDGSFCTAADKKSGYQCGTAPKPRILSISYGSTEVAIPQAAVVRTCNEIMKLSLQGSTFIIASGDYGVANGPGKNYNGCINPAQPNKGVSGTVFSPDFPADCPYVLAVGATELVGGETPSDPEHVMDIPGLGASTATFSSGGGFSNYFKRPSYQDAAVSEYLANHVPPYKSYVYNGQDLFSGNSNIGANGGLYNRAGRGFPDVAANGVNFTTFVEGNQVNEFGTSLAAPIWASVLTLVNQQLTAAKKPPVGFVNPLLYKNPQAFHDITIGSNPGCGTNGFPAVAGWDPSTGLGTPNYPKILSAALAAATTTTTTTSSTSTATATPTGYGGSPPSYGSR